MNFKSLATQPPKDFILMLLGGAGSGKSTFASRFPKPFFLSLDKNLRGPAAVMATEGKTDIGYFDEFDVDDNGKELDIGLRFNRVALVLSAICADPAWETVVIDNATILSDYIMADILRQQNRKTPIIQDWGTFGGAWKMFLAKLRSANKKVILIVHERLEKDDLDGSLRYFLAIPGQTGDILPTLVTDVWRCEVEEKLVGTTRQHVRQIRVVQSQRHAHLKTSSPDLPTVFPATTEMVNKILTGIKK